MLLVEISKRGSLSDLHSPRRAVYIYPQYPPQFPFGFRVRRVLLVIVSVPKNPPRVCSRWTITRSIASPPLFS